MKPSRASEPGFSGGTGGFGLSNVVEMSEARRRRHQLGETSRTFCSVLIAAQVPSTLTAEDVLRELERCLDARGVKVFGETGSPATLSEETSRQQ